MCQGLKFMQTGHEFEALMLLKLYFPCLWTCWLLLIHSFVYASIIYLIPQRNSQILVYFDVDLYFNLVIEEPTATSEVCCYSYFKYCFFLVSLLGQKEKKPTYKNG